MSGAWINLKNLDSINREELTRVFQIMQVTSFFLHSETVDDFAETAELKNVWEPEFPVQQQGDSPPAHLSDDHEQREHHGQPQVLWPVKIQFKNEYSKELPTDHRTFQNLEFFWKSFFRPVYFEESDEKTALKFALLQKGCARLTQMKFLCTFGTNYLLTQSHSSY